MRVAVISHTYVVATNRGKLEALEQHPDLTILSLIPSYWINRDMGQVLHLERLSSSNLSIVSLPIWFAGYGSLLLYSPIALLRVLREFQPELIHLEEEPWSLAALELCLISRLLGTRFVFFTWENIRRSLPLPFRLIRRLVFRLTHGAVAGNQEAMHLLKREGFRAPITVIPQLGINPSFFSPGREAEPKGNFVIGYVGRLVPQKGVLLLLEAAARLPQTSVLLVGSGPLKQAILSRAASPDLNGRLELCEGVRHHEVPQYIRRMSALVLPSLTTQAWKEQFGHVLIEAMSCGVPVIGSDSGAIPEVIENAGLVVKEGDVDKLTSALGKLISKPKLRQELSARGHSRVLEEYTNSTVAKRVATFWRTLVHDT
jgi:glycosyltransferase involved in cell wall biosynthesis